MATASFTSHLDPAPQNAGNPGLWTRLRRAVARATIERTEREIADYLEQNGGRLTDQLERRILDRVAGLDRPGLW
jgi:hypothetical protein